MTVRSGSGLGDALALIVVTGPTGSTGRSVVETVRAALQAGAGAVQLRSKSESAREMVALADALLRETRQAGALLFVNDRLDVALAAGTDGAHLGDDDLPLPAARSIAPPDFFLGSSADSPLQARNAERSGADYIGVGPVFTTSSKPDAGEAVGVARIREVVGEVKIPVVGIGGIGAENAAAVTRAGASGVAVIRAVMAAEEPEFATRQLLQAIQTGVRERIGKRS